MGLDMKLHVAKERGLFLHLTVYFMDPGGLDSEGKPFQCNERSLYASSPNLKLGSNSIHLTLGQHQG